MSKKQVRNIFESTESFESWMRKRTDLSKRLLKKKHRQMAAGPFPFLRSTFYRWVEQWPRLCPELAGRPDDELLVVGDLHVANFGVWCDSRRRQVWGVNDFDEACELAFTSDLVRLATSAVLAAAEAEIDVETSHVCELLLAGYRAGLRSADPILVNERHQTLIKLTRQTEEDPKTFWQKKLRAEDNPPIDAPDLPEGLEDMFRASFRPGAKLAFLAQRSPGGLGSLGRRRFTAVETKKGVYEAREAKALVPSAQYWITKRDDMPSQTATLLQHAVRIPDPFFQVHDRWLIRQLAPDIAKIDMPQPQDKRLALAPDLLRLMGRETANSHMGSRTTEDLVERLDALEQTGRGWFPAATDRMVDSVRKDHAKWKERH
jgi:Ser/Thr protein kinase RdoA (MazF antagonist)